MALTVARVFLMRAMQFFEDQLLEFVCRLALPGVDASLGEQALGIDFRLRQQQPKADVLRRQKLLGRRSADAQMVTALMTIDFMHRQLYHPKSGPAQTNCRGSSSEYCRFRPVNACNRANIAVSGLPTGVSQA